MTSPLSFSGTAPDLTSSQVLATFKRAAPYLDITPRLVHFIDLLMSWSRDLDWREGSRPIVWPSNRLLQDELALERTQVKSLIRCSIESGLINPVESPNGKRYGFRNSRGRIVQAFGFDLSPLAVRLDEFAAAADTARADREARKALRRRLTIAYKAILQLAETGSQYEVASDDWSALAVTAQDIAVVGRQAETLTELTIDESPVCISGPGVRLGKQSLRVAGISQDLNRLGQKQPSTKLRLGSDWTTLWKCHRIWIST